MHPKQGQAMSLLTNPEHSTIREVLFGGAKGGGKSFLGASWETLMAIQYPGTSWFVARENLTDLRKHTIPTFHEVFKILDIGFNNYKFNGMDNIFTFSNGSRIIFVSAQYLPSDQMFERFGSMQNTGGWIEEGGEIDEMAYSNLKLTIGRCKNEEYNIPFKLLITANPKKNWMHRDFIRTITPDKRYIQSFAKDNRYLPAQYQETLEGIKDKRDRQRLLLGMWDYDDDDNSLISFEKIQDLFTNSFVEEGEKCISSDVAITNDLFVNIAWSGLKILEISAIQNVSKTVSTHENGAVVNKVDFTPLINEYERLTTKYKIPRSNIVYDADGIGHHLRDFLSGAVGLNNNAAAFDPAYQNLKTQLYYLFAEFVNSNRIWVVPDAVYGQVKERLIDELQAIKRSSDVGEKLKIMPKAEVKNLIGHSPDLTDAIVYRLLFWITRGK